MKFKIDKWAHCKKFFINNIWFIVQMCDLWESYIAQITITNTIWCLFPQITITIWCLFPQITITIWCLFPRITITNWCLFTITNCDQPNLVPGGCLQNHQPNLVLVSVVPLHKSLFECVQFYRHSYTWHYTIEALCSVYSNANKISTSE